MTTLLTIRRPAVGYVARLCEKTGALMRSGVRQCRQVGVARIISCRGRCNPSVSQLPLHLRSQPRQNSPRPRWR